MAKEQGYHAVDSHVTFLKSAWRHSVIDEYDKAQNNPYFAPSHLGDKLCVYRWPQCNYNKTDYRKLLLEIGVRVELDEFEARRGGAEVAGWTLDRKIRVQFPAYPHRVWALWWQGGKRHLRMSRCPCRGRLGTLKTPSCPWRGCPAADQNLENGHLSRHYIAEISLNVTLNHNQHQHQRIWTLGILIC